MVNEKNKTYPVPERIKEARIARGFTQVELADVIGVTRQAICQYESGSNHPKPEILNNIVEKLDFPYNYFYKPINYHITTPIFFRSYKTADRKDREMLKSRIVWMAEIYSYLKQFLNFANVNVYREEKERYTQDEIEEIAFKVRKSWGLGQGPISNVVLLLENNGFLLSRISLGKRKVDACSLINTSDYEFRPMICLTGDKSSAVRSRFDAAHELGHIVLHSWVDDEYLSIKENQDRIEQEAHTFAGAFLLPFVTFSKEAYSISNLDLFINLKRRWRVSIAAMVKRCFDTGIITKSQYEYLQRQISSRRYRDNEPLDDELPDEQPKVFQKAMEMLIENRVQSGDEIREEIRLPLEEIEMLCGLGSSTFRVKKEPHLKLVHAT